MKNLNKELKNRKMKKLRMINEILEDDEVMLTTKFIKTLEKQEIRINKKVLKKTQKTYE